MKRIISTLIMLSLLFSSSMIVNASSSDKISRDPVEILRGEDASDDLIKYIESNDVTVDDNSVIEVSVIKSNNSSDLVPDNTNKALALLVTNISGTVVTKDIILSVANANENDGFPIAPCAGTTIEFPPDSWDKRLTIRGTAVYDLRSDGLFTYHRPYGCYFRYSKGTASVVSYVSVKYICDGFVYTYPGFESLGYEVQHVVHSYKSNPSQNTIYSATNNFPSNRVISVSSGSPSVGNFLTFNFTADGKSDGYTVKF